MLSVAGEPLHTRSLTVRLQQGTGGKIHAEGQVIDLRKQSFTPNTDDLQTSGIIHHMKVRLELDSATRVLERIEVEQPTVAFEPSATTGGESCRDPAPRLRALEGERLDEGFPRRLSRAFGGALGCSHVLTTFQLMASTLPLALELEKERGGARQPGERIYSRSLFVDGYTVEAGLQMAVLLGDFRHQPREVARMPLRRLDTHWEVRVRACVDLDSLELRELAAVERERTLERFAEAAWRDRTGALAGLAGRRIMPGLAPVLFDLLGSDPRERRLLDSLLQLAPGFIQCLSARTERWLSAHGLEGAGPATSLAGVGGVADSCYMWRASSPLLQIRSELVKK